MQAVQKNKIYLRQPMLSFFKSCLEWYSNPRPLTSQVCALPTATEAAQLTEIELHRLVTGQE